MLIHVKAEHLSVHQLREVLIWITPGHSAMVQCCVPISGFSYRLACVSVGKRAGYFSIQLLGNLPWFAGAEGASQFLLKAKSEEPSWQLLGQWLPPLLPHHWTGGCSSFSFLRKLTLYLTMHWYPAALNNNLTAGRPLPGARLREQSECWLNQQEQTRPCSWWQQPPCRWKQAPGQCWWAPRQAQHLPLWA